MMLREIQMKSLTEEKWQAIINNDCSYDDSFIYAVETTKIFCKPSCKSRDPIKHNVLIFVSAQDALQAGFRPCKRCKPTNRRLPEREWVLSVKKYIEDNYHEKLTLQLLAELSHSSPYHLQRTFKKQTNLTPSQYTRKIRVKIASELLSKTNKSIREIADQVGIGNNAYFITTFKQETGFTPLQYRQLNQNS